MKRNFCTFTCGVRLFLRLQSWFPFGLAMALTVFYLLVHRCIQNSNDWFPQNLFFWFLFLRLFLFHCPICFPFFPKPAAEPNHMNSGEFGRFIVTYSYWWLVPTHSIQQLIFPPVTNRKDNIKEKQRNESQIKDRKIKIAFFSHTIWGFCCKRIELVDFICSISRCTLHQRK